MAPNYDKKVPDFEKKVPESKKVSELDKKYMKKARRHIGQNIVQITMKMRKIVRIIQIIMKPHLKNSEKKLTVFFKTISTKKKRKKDKR